MNSSEEYKYYKITRDDGYTDTCNILGWIKDYFNRRYGEAETWKESNEKYKMKMRKGEILEIPLWIEASTNYYDFRIVLSKQEYVKVELSRNFIEWKG